MQYNIQGHHLNVGDALKTHIEDRLSAINEKYFNRGVEANITLTKDGGSLYKTHISMKGGKDITIQADADAHDPYGAFEEAAEKVAKQLRRYKRRLRNHHEQISTAEAAEIIAAQSYVLSGPTAANDDEDDTGENGEEPLIIAENTSDIQTLSVADAVMLLELSGESALLFKNSKTKRMAMVHTRKDGNIGWVEAKD